jgi:hypothetical protein
MSRGCIRPGGNAVDATDVVMLAAPAAVGGAALAALVIAMLIGLMPGGCRTAAANVQAVSADL